MNPVESAHHKFGQWNWSQGKQGQLSPVFEISLRNNVKTHSSDSFPAPVRGNTIGRARPFSLSKTFETWPQNLLSQTWMTLEYWFISGMTCSLGQHLAKGLSPGTEPSVGHSVCVPCKPRKEKLTTTTPPPPLGLMAELIETSFVFLKHLYTFSDLQDSDEA